jgi:hypothetical protein
MRRDGAMTKHVHMGPPTTRFGTPAGRSEHRRPLPSWFVFVALIAYAATVGFGDNDNPGPASWAQVAQMLSDRWHDSMQQAPRVLAPLREEGWSVLPHRGAQTGSASGGSKDAAKSAAQPKHARQPQ